MSDLIILDKLLPSSSNAEDMPLSYGARTIYNHTQRPFLGAADRGRQETVLRGEPTEPSREVGGDYLHRMRGGNNAHTLEQGKRPHYRMKNHIQNKHRMNVRFYRQRSRESEINRKHIDQTRNWTTNTSEMENIRAGGGGPEH